MLAGHSVYKGYIMTEKVTTHFSNGERFGLDPDKKIAGFKGINLTELGSTLSYLSTPDAANGGVLAAHTTDAITHSIRIDSEDGTNYYVMCTTTVTNRS
jgi:hypothetical protein